MKKLILQVMVPGKKKSEGTFSYIPEMYEYSEYFARSYANRTGANYYKVTRLDDYLGAKDMEPAYQKLKFYDFTDYDQILFLDSDYIIKNNAPDIFELYPNSTSACLDNFEISKKLSDNIGVPHDKYFNTGMMLLKKEDLLATQKFLAEYLVKDWEYCDQGLINSLFFKNGIEVNYLNAELWNPAYKCFGEYSDHYAGPYKNLWDKNRYIK